MNKLNILLLCHSPKYNANAINDHIDAFVNYSNHNIYRLSSLGVLPKFFELDNYDAIIIHYSCTVLSDFYLNKKSKERIRNYKGLKVLLAQDEYRLVDKFIETVNYLKIDVLFTCYPEPEIEKVYPEARLPNVRKVNNLTGYVPERLLSINKPKIRDRSVHVGYRARKVPFSLGFLGKEKWDIVDKFSVEAKGKGVLCDISYREQDRIYGQKWINFLLNCKSTLGVESGASIIDFTGELHETVEQYMKRMPKATFEEVHKLFLEKHEGKIKMNQVSPRVFEAAALKTVMVLYEGEYSNVLKPWLHYIPLKKDFSNIDQVLDYLKDDEKLQKMADQTFDEIALNNDCSFRSFISKFDNVVSEEFSKRNKTRTLNTMSRLRFKFYSKAVRFCNILNPVMLWNSTPNSLQKYLMPVLKPIYHRLLRKWKSPK